MWWAIDVQYADDHAMVAGVGFTSFAEEEGEEAILRVEGPPAAYEPGQFYRRELPLLLAFIGDRHLKGVVVDGFVWLGEDRPGLGAHLHAARPDLAVIGVAKTGFQGAESVATPVYRGESARPLWVTAEGIELDRASRWVRDMHGEYRLPTLLKRVDRLAREG